MFFREVYSKKNHLKESAFKENASRDTYLKENKFERRCI
jgi:hypothetical protein